MQDRLSQIEEYLPIRLRRIIQKISPHHRENITELRLRRRMPLTLSLGDRVRFLDNSGEPCLSNGVEPVAVSDEELMETFMNCCEHSVYKYENEICQGFLTLRAGHRVGVCGTAVMQEGRVASVREISSLNIRIAREIKGCSAEINREDISGGLLIAGLPGSGKTTLLRDVVRRMSNGEFGEMKRVAVCDERGEIAACHKGVAQNDLGYSCDVLSMVPKSQGIMMALRTLSPHCIVFDEFSMEEAEIISRLASFGVDFITTMHIGDEECLKENVAFCALASQIKNLVVLGDSVGTPFKKYRIRRGLDEGHWDIVPVHSSGFCGDHTIQTVNIAHKTVGEFRKMH